jgi:hypothetical protein
MSHGACLHQRLQDVDARHGCRQGQNARSPFIKVNVKQPGTFGNAAGFLGVSTKEEDT